MTPDEFTALIGSITARIEGRQLDAALAAELEDSSPMGSAKFDAVFAACRDGVAAGWVCNREAGGIRYGRVVKPGPATHAFRSMWSRWRMWSARTTRTPKVKSTW
jgi:hypothetical protein